MNERFTEAAKKVIALASGMAQRFGHDYIGTEHILLGFLKNDDSIAKEALENCGLTYEKAEETIRKIITVHEVDEEFSKLSITPRVKFILDLANSLSVKMGHGYIGTEHLLLAFLSESDSIGMRVLAAHNIKSNQVVDALSSLLEEGTLAEKTSSGEPMVFSGTGSEENPISGGTDLNLLAKQGKIDPVVGRSDEITRVIQILSRRTKNNPVLIGEPGVGKTAIAEGLASRIVEGNVPDMLKNKRIISLNIANLLAGTSFRGQFEEKLKKVIETVQHDENIILFIDELHTMIGAGANKEDGMDAANILKPALARGDFQVIGATTLDEYKKYIEKDAALERRFQPVKVGEPSEEDALKILEGLRDRYEAFHKVKITDEALQAAVSLSARYISDRFLPDKAIDLMDEAASKIRLNAFTTGPNVKDLENKLQRIRKEKEAAVTAQNFEYAARLRDEEKEVSAELDAKIEEGKNVSMETLVVTEEDIAEVLSNWTKIPVSKLTEEESKKLLSLEDHLHERVIGQNEAVVAVAKAVRRARAGLKDPKRPIGSFLFLGPTGVGKTELARALAEDLFGDETAMVRLDMSEYMEKHNVSRLVGAPPGYVGFDEGGQLTDAIRRKPYSVILFDEVEKAHPDFFNMLLQVLDDGRLTDNQGRTVDFRNTVIIMTSNLGAKNLQNDSAAMGFLSDKKDDKEGLSKASKDAVMKEVKRHFRPEFLNRIDEMVVFDALTSDDLKEIVHILLKDLLKRLAKKDMTLAMSDEAIDKLVKEGSDVAYGARPLKRAIQKFVEDPISELILSGHAKDGDLIDALVEEDKIKFIVRKDA